MPRAKRSQHYRMSHLCFQHRRSHTAPTGGLGVPGKARGVFSDFPSGPDVGKTEYYSDMLSIIASVANTLDGQRDS
jgi:hypothetical protein